MFADQEFKPWLGLLVLGAILCVQLTLVICVPKGVSWDPSYGLLAAQQHLSGVSPDISTLIKVRSDNINQVSSQPITWWPSGYQAVPYFLRLGVFDWGVALNLTLGLTLIIGTVGWFIYFYKVLSSYSLALWLSAAVALTRFRWTMALTYDGGDQLVWGAAPWVLIIAAAALRAAQNGSMKRSGALSAFGGAAGASLFTLKYSGIFFSIGVAAVFAIICLRHRYWQQVLIAGVSFIAVLLFFGLPLGGNPASVSHPDKANILRAVASLGLPAIGVTDIDYILRSVLTNTSLGGRLTPAFIGAGLTLVIFIGVVAYYRGSSARFVRGDRVLIGLAIGAIIADFAFHFILNLKGASVGAAGRYGRVSGLLLLPLLVTAWQAMLQGHRSIWRVFAVLGILSLLVFPALLATARQLPNIVERLERAASITDHDGIMNVRLSPGTDVKAFYAQVESFATKSALYTIYPQMAFPLPRRPLILVGAEERKTPETLSRKRYFGRNADGVALLLPVAFEGNGKLDAIRASFVEIDHFVRHELPADPKWALWISVD